MPRFVYFYLMSNKPDAIRSVASRHAAYWHEQRLPGYQGGPFEDRSGGLILLYLRDRITFPPPLLYGGLALAGLLVVAMGIDDVCKRRASFSDSEYNYYATYYGFSAIMWGSFFILLGLSMVVAGAILLLGMVDAASTFLKARPGAALVLAGAVMVCYGIPTILGSVEERSSFWRLLGSAPGRLLGIVLVLAGLLIILLGGWEIVAPHAFDKLVGQAASSFPVLPE